MRAPYQILAIPYKVIQGDPLFCVFRRSDCGQWQFVAGGGEDNEMPIEAAKREIFEETGITADDIIPLQSICHIPVSIFPSRYLYHWDKDIYVIPEYTFAFKCSKNIVLSHEHMEYAWLPYKEAKEKLKWDSNRTALYELNCKLDVISLAEQ